MNDLELNQSHSQMSVYLEECLQITKLCVFHTYFCSAIEGNVFLCFVSCLTSA